MKPIIAASLLVLCLSGCGSPSDEDVLTDEKIRASQSAAQLPDIELSDNPEPPPAPVVEQPLANEVGNELMGNELIDNAVEPVSDGPIPPAFQARWATRSEDCRPGEVLGNALVITSETLMSGESVGRLTQSTEDSPERFVGIFEYDGTEREEQLVLTGSSNTLIRISGGQRYAYRRCGAARPTG